MYHMAAGAPSGHIFSPGQPLPPAASGKLPAFGSHHHLRIAEELESIRMLSYDAIVSVEAVEGRRVENEET